MQKTIHNIMYLAAGFILAAILIPQIPRINLFKPSVLGLEVKNEFSYETKATPEIALKTEPPQLTAKAALAFDLGTESILYAHNFDASLPVASLTKLMTALVVFDTMNLDEEVTITKFDTQIVGNSMGLAVSEKIKAYDLLLGMLISSNNDAALALTTHKHTYYEFVDLMNEKAKNLNLHSTRFTNPVGWDADESYSNASDLSKLTLAFISNPKLAQIVAIKEAVVYSVDKKYSHQLKTTNQLLLEDSRVSGIKTGFTSKALGNLILRVKNRENEIVTIVLGSNDREEDTKKLMGWVFSVYRW